MEPIKKYISIFSALIATTLIVRHEVINVIYNQWFALDFLVTIITYTLGLLIAIPTLIYSIRQLKRKKSAWNLTPIVILGIGTLTAIGLLAFGKIENKSPIIFTAHCDSDLNNLYLDLRQDGTYHIDNNFVLSGEFLEGNYKINGDTIILNNAKPLGKDNDYMTNKLIIKSDTLLFQLDKNGNYKLDWTMEIVENKLMNIKKH